VKIRTEYITAVLLFFPLLIIQITIVPLIAINGVIPDLIIILLVYYTLQFGQIEGAVLGFAYGLFYDLITGGLLGSSMLSKALTGFIAGYFFNENKKDIYLKSYLFPLIVLLGSTIDSFILSFFSTIELNTNVLGLFIQQGLLPGIYTAIFSIIVVIFYPRRSLE
jgi:rod shape-determining protein MreD